MPNLFKEPSVGLNTLNFNLSATLAKVCPETLLAHWPESDSPNYTIFLQSG